jgi:serine protease Do
MKALDNNFNNFDPLGTNDFNGKNADTNSYGNGNFQEPPSPQPQSYSPQSGYYYPKKPVKPKKVKKNKNGIGIVKLIACCLVCSIIAASASAGAIYYLIGNNTIASPSGTTTNITVDKSSTNVVSAIAEKTVPSVVGIAATTSVNSFFGFSTDSSSEGSGVVYSEDGYIITNYHVISSVVESTTSGKISVYLSTDSETAIEASVVGYNSDYDLAVIKIDKSGLTAIEFADSNDVSVGDMAVAIGNPGGLNYMSSVSSGIISGLNRTIQLEGTAQMKLLQTDAAINPGNSGGALVDCNGKLIGINSSKISSEEYEGMGFAIPSNTVKKVVSNIINNKDKTYAYVGVTVSTSYTEEMLESVGYPAGAVVESVTEGSPADKIGIKSADIIVSFDGVEIKNYEDYNNERLKHSPGETVSITVYRNGKNLEGSITLGESNN